MKKVLFLFVLIFTVTASHACLNYYYSIDNKAHFHDAEDLRGAFNTNFNTTRLEKNLKKLQLKLEASRDYKLLSDYAVLLLKAGKTSVALDILEQLSLKHPDDYQIAANLGTAYELSGNNEKALEFINRGLDLNPDSHDGSEWVHAKLLDTKLKLEKDSSYLDDHTVLDLTDDLKKDVQIRDQLLIQIRERFPFCKGPDPIMASLLLDLGDCCANTASIEFAKATYEIAKHYYNAPDEIVDPKIEEMKYLLRQYIGVNVDRAALRREDDHGSHIRMSQIRYQKLLDDNNPSEYKIDWATVQFNADSLLSYADIERVIPEPIEVEEVIDTPLEEKMKPEKKDQGNLNWIYFLIGGLGIGGGALFLYSRRKR